MEKNRIKQLQLKYQMNLKFSHIVFELFLQGTARIIYVLISFAELPLKR